MGVAVSFLFALLPCQLPVIRRSPELVDVRHGVGGKTPRRPSWTRPSPYNRPPKEKRRGWFSKLLVRPSIFSFFTGDGDPRPYETLPVAAVETVGPKIGFQSHSDEIFTQPVSDDDNGLAQIERRLKDEIFSRNESIHLIKLLRSRTPDLSDDGIDHTRSILHAVETTSFHNISRDAVDYPRNLRTIKPFRAIPKRRSVLNDDHVQVKSISYVRQRNMAAAASDSPFDSKGISWPYKRKSEDISSTVHPQVSAMAQKILEHIFQPDTPTEESQNLEQAFSRPELPSSTTQTDFSWPTLTKSQETQSIVLLQTTGMAQTALEHIERSIFDKEKPQELVQAFPIPELPPSATSLMDGHDNNSDMRIPDDCKIGSLVDREMDTPEPEHSRKLFLWPASSKSQEFESTVHSKPSNRTHEALEIIDRSLSTKGQLEALEITSSPPEPPPNSATFLMDGQNQRPDSRTYDDRSDSSKGKLEKLELNFLPEPPPNFATFMMDGQDERPDSMTYEDQSVSLKGQLEEKELTFSLPNLPSNSATFLMNDQDERPDLRTHDDDKTWSFVGNKMDISDREDSEEILSDISTSESEDLDLHRPSKRARTSDSGFSGTFSIPLNLFGEPTPFPAHTFKSKGNQKLGGWPGYGVKCEANF